MIAKTLPLQRNLKNRYQKEVKLKLWPPVTGDKYFSLTMYDTLQAEFREELTKNEQYYVHDVKTLDLEEIFHYNLPIEDRVILVEGNAGIGKTFLANELCKRWSNNSLLLCYNLMIMIQLRDPNVQKNMDLKQLLNYQLQGVGDMTGAVEAISSSGGSSLFLILDGYDELPLKLRCMSIFAEIIQGRCLPNATILVTCRRSVSHELHSVASKKIVITGFNPTQIDHFISVNLAQPKAEELMTQLSHYPNVYNLCQVPASLAIVVHLFMLQSRLPTTITELYYQFILNFLFNYMQDVCRHPSIQHLQSIEKLPSGVQSKYWSLCKLALLGINSRQLVFHEEEISKHLGEQIPNEYDGLGLLHITHHTELAGRSRTFNFIHLTTQEFLAAHYLTKLPSQIVRRAVKSNMTNPEYHTVCRFYAGLTKLRSSYIRKAVFEAFQFLVKEVIEKNERTCKLKESKKTIINIFHCCYETQDNSLCKIAANFLTEFTLDLSDCICLPQDVMVMAHFITKSSKQWNLYLDNCYIRGKGLHILINVLAKSQQHHVIKSASFTSNRLQLNSAEPLTHLLRAQASLHTLNLKHNQLGDQGVEQLAQCLQTNNMLKHLNISSNNIGDSGARSIGLMLQRNCTLQSLFLSKNSIGPVGVECIAEGLKNVRSSLKSLSLDINKFGQDGAKHLAEGIQMSHSLATLNISNCYIGPGGAHAIAQAINTYPKTMTNLSLECNKIIRSPLSKPIVCFLFECESLRVLNIRCNSLGPEGTLAIAEGLRHNETLQELDISGTSCTGNSAIQIADSLQANKSLQVLNITDNKIGTEASVELASSLYQNVTLKCLKMDRTASTAENFESFTQMVPFFPVHTLHLCDNSIPSNLIVSMCYGIKNSRHSILSELKIHHYDAATKEKISLLKEMTNQLRKKANKKFLVINYGF